MFAIFMGMANLGNDTGFYLGSGLLRLLGGVNAPDFENLTEYVILRALARLIPTALIPFLVPAGGPADTAVDMGAGIGVTGTVETTSATGGEISVEAGSSELALGKVKVANVLL